MYKLYLEFCNGTEGYYCFEHDERVRVSPTLMAFNIAKFPSEEAAERKAKRLIGAGYRIAYYEVVI